jgi:hypothetical protein
MNRRTWQAPAGTSVRLGRAVAVLGGRLARMVAQLSDEPGGLTGHGEAFLWSCYEAATLDRQRKPGIALQPCAAPHPIDRLASRFSLSSTEIELLLLAGMPEENEGYSAVLRSLHPRGEPRPSAGLASQLIFAGREGRQHCRAVLENGALVRSGIVRLSGDGPLFERSLLPAERIWPALHGVDAWPAGIDPLDAPAGAVGLERWLAAAPARRALEALRRGEICTVEVTGDDATAAFYRAIALVAEAGRVPVAVPASVSVDPEWQRLMDVHTTLRDAVPVLRMVASEGPVAAEDVDGIECSGPLVVAGASVPPRFARGRSLLSVPVEPLSSADRIAAWSELVPVLGACTRQIASRYPLEPFRVAEAARDLEMIGDLERRDPTAADVSQVLRFRGRRSLTAGVKLVRSQAVWEDLVLRSDLMAQLHEAADRLALQSRVLDDWGFLQNRSGARGVRLLFAGPPGTGKTLSAEVLAHALDADLLIVDVSRVVSKWVGETEKNLAAVFDAAENSQAVVLFDEADALFARRTEVSGAHDRYANLETAYLLQRLERFEGLAILATNLRQNIDAAFVRRLEFVLEFSEPDREQRVALWKRHVPAGAPVDRELNYYELAALYPVVGGVIRNAAVAAAFLAAADGMKLCREHFIHAIRREYEKAGKAFPGLPAGMRN